MEWLLLYRNMPIEIKSFLNENIGDLADFESTPCDVSGVFVYDSPSTFISLSYAFEMDGQLLIVWPPGIDDPTEEDNMIFVQNSFGQEIAI